jgi:hypothetical protein
VPNSGVYDVFAYFWAHVTNNWQIQVGLDVNNLMQVRDNGAQQAELAQFDAASASIVLSSGGASLYRTYVGRSVAIDGEPINVFVNDSLFNASGATGFNRTWYDGIGYALVRLWGDFNGDQLITAADIDLLYDSISASDPGADLNRDSLVNQADADYMVTSILDTWYGDVDLNRKVDVVDLGLLASNWQGTGSWSQADFTGDGIIDVADLGLLATNWQAGVAGSALSFADVLQSFGLSPSTIPEPGFVAWFALLTLLHRRCAGQLRNTR